MKKIAILLVVLVLVSSIFVLAKPNLVPATNEKSGRTLVIPEHAVQIADNVFSLGTAQDVDGRVVEGFMFINNRKTNAKPGTVCGNNVCEPGEKKSCPADCGSNGGGESKCFSLFAKGSRWKTTEPYITDNEIDLSLTETSLNTWDSEVDFNIFGTGTAGTTDEADDISPDDKNEVMFENLGATNTIAYAIVWGIFSGHPKNRELVEWDVVFNTDFVWSLTGEEGKMDYQNIATHEFGHALGLGHPDSSCIEETMYAYAEFGETKKRTLEAGDIAGINKLY